MADIKIKIDRGEIIEEFKCHVNGMHNNAGPGYSEFCDICDAYCETLNGGAYAKVDPEEKLD